MTTSNLKYPFSMLAIALCSIAHSQSYYSKKTKSADKAYNHYHYTKAVQRYESYLPSNDSVYIYQQLSNSYLHLNEPSKAEPYLERLVAIEPLEDPIYYMNYADVLSSEGKYDDAKRWYHTYNQHTEDDDRADAKLAAISDLEDFFKDSADFTLEKTTFNSAGLDFSPSYYQEGVVFASSRPALDRTGNKRFNWDKSPYLDLYYSKEGKSAAKNFEKPINSVYHEGPTSFYSNETKLVFTRNNYDGELSRDDEGVARLKLFFSEQSDEGWSEPSPFPYNSDAYSTGHPTITEDGQVMIFSSDMAGGHGKSDLYITFWENGKWSTPRNLGETVNTEGRESFPFLIDKRLFFASDGHGGLGGLDIFEVEIDENYEVTSRFRNVGYPINSSRDDFGLITKDDISSGYFTSARNEPTKDDIYYFERFSAMLEVVVVDKATGDPIAGATVSYLEDNVDIGDLVSSAAGLSGMEINKNKDYLMEASAEGYLTNNTSASSYGIENRTTLKRIIELEAIKEEETAPEFVDLVVFMNISGVHQAFIEDQEEIYELVLDQTDELWLEGRSERIDLEHLELEADMDIIAKTKEIMAHHNKPVRNVIRINSIFYDFDRYHIRQDAEAELEKVKQILDKYGYTDLDLESHTDSRGSHAYNETLAKNRALSAKAYLSKAGIAASRLFIDHHGERVLLNDCHNNKLCHEDLHQNNRRTEMILEIRKTKATVE